MKVLAKKKMGVWQLGSTKVSLVNFGELKLAQQKCPMK